MAMLFGWTCPSEVHPKSFGVLVLVLVLLLVLVSVLVHNPGLSQVIIRNIAFQLFNNQMESLKKNGNLSKIHPNTNYLVLQRVEIEPRLLSRGKYKAKNSWLYSNNPLMPRPQPWSTDKLTRPRFKSTLAKSASDNNMNTLTLRSSAPDELFQK